MNEEKCVSREVCLVTKKNKLHRVKQGMQKDMAMATWIWIWQQPTNCWSVSDHFVLRHPRKT